MNTVNNNLKKITNTMAAELVEASKTIKNEEGEEEKVTGKVTYDCGDDLEEMTEIFGETLVYQLAKREIHRKLKSTIRRELKSGTSPVDIPNALSDWRPDVKHTVSKDPLQAGEEAFNAMSPEAQEKYIQKLREKAKAAQQEQPA